MPKLSYNIPFRRYSAIISVLIVLIMTVLDVSVVNVALPVLAVKFGVSDSVAVWIVTVYQLIVTMLLLPLSSIGDRFGYKRNFLWGVAIFTVASLFCALADSFSMIVAARLIQGIGAALVMSVNIALTRTIYPKKILGRGLALNAISIAVATAAGPTLAGFILSFASWHWLFIINIPFGIIAFIVALKRLPPNPPREIKGEFDWLSGVMNVVVFGLIFYALGSFAKRGDTAISLLLLVAGLIIGRFYVRRQFQRPEPLLPVDLFKSRVFSLSICTSICSFIAQNLAIISLPFLFLNSYHFSEVATGLLITPWPLATMIISPLAARFVERHNPSITAGTGLIVYVVGLILILIAPAKDISVWNMAWRIAVCGVGYGLYQTPNNIVMVFSTPFERTGGAGGMQGTARLIGQTLGATLVTVIFALFYKEPVRICLCIAILFALIGTVLSMLRTDKSDK